MEARKEIVVCSSDRKIFIEEEEVMLQAETIKNMLENGCFNYKIPVIVDDMDKSTPLSKVIDYCYVHTYSKDHPDDLDAWDANLINDDPNTLIVEEEVMLLAQTIKNMLKEYGSFNDKILVIDVDSTILAKVIDYCYVHTRCKNHTKWLDAWDARFVNVDPKTLGNLMMAANYLNIESLVDLLVPALDKNINKMSEEEMCKIFFKVESRIDGEELKES